jgi:hypothetical protein
MAEIFLYVGKEMDIQVQEAFRTSNRYDLERTSPCHIIVKILRVQNKKRILKAARENAKFLTKAKQCADLTQPLSKFQRHSSQK